MSAIHFCALASEPKYPAWRTKPVAGIVLVLTGAVTVAVVDGVEGVLAAGGFAGILVAVVAVAVGSVLLTGVDEAVGLFEVFVATLVVGVTAVDL